MINKVKCPKCGKIVFADDDVLDSYEKDDKVVWDCLGFCFNCHTRFLYTKTFEFSEYGEPEVYEG